MGHGPGAECCTFTGPQVVAWGGWVAQFEAFAVIGSSDLTQVAGEKG